MTLTMTKFSNITKTTKLNIDIWYEHENYKFLEYNYREKDKMKSWY